MSKADHNSIRDGCRGARVLAEWAAEMGFDERGQQLAPILFSGVFTQDSRLLHSLGGFDRELAIVVRAGARKARIWHGAGVVGSDWSDDELGEFSFLLDLMVICGTIRRVNRRDQETRYVALK